MATYYQALRIQPEKDFQGKSEEDIKKKIESNYNTLVARAPQMYPAAPVREQMLTLMEEARTVLSDQKQREAYDKKLKDEIEKREKDMVSIEIVELTDEIIEELREEMENEEEE